MSETVRVWTRKEIEERAAVDPESASYIRMRVSVKFLKTLIDFAAANGEIIEIISARGEIGDAELHFFRRD